MSITTDKIYLCTPGPNYDESRSFYEGLGFKRTAEDSTACIFSDINFDIYINRRTSGRLGYVMFTDNLDQVRDVVPESRLYPVEDGFVTADPNGVRLFIYPKKTSPTIDKSDVNEKNICGNYYGSGIETTQLIETADYWKNFGYSAQSDIDEKASYVPMSREGGPPITLFKPGMCPHSFYNPSLTYFNGKKGNPQVIEKLRNARVRIAEEITLFNDAGDVDNIIISDPGGLHSFIFNDG